MKPLIIAYALNAAIVVYHIIIAVRVAAMNL